MSEHNFTLELAGRALTVTGLSTVHCFSKDDVRSGLEYEIHDASGELLFDTSGYIDASIADDEIDACAKQLLHRACRLCPTLSHECVLTDMERIEAEYAVLGFELNFARECYRNSGKMLLKFDRKDSRNEHPIFRPLVIHKTRNPRPALQQPV